MVVLLAFGGISGWLLMNRYLARVGSGRTDNKDDGKTVRADAGRTSERNDDKGVREDPQTLDNPPTEPAWSRGKDPVLPRDIAPEQPVLPPRGKDPPPPRDVAPEQPVKPPSDKEPVLPGDGRSRTAGQNWLSPLEFPSGCPRSRPPRVDALNNRRWDIVGNELRCLEANFVPRIQIPYQPPQEYDFVVTFSQPTLRNGIALIMPHPNGGSFFFWAIGAGGRGEEYGFFGNSIRNAKAPGLLKPSRPLTTMVQVRRDGVRAFVERQADTPGRLPRPHVRHLADHQ